MSLDPAAPIQLAGQGSKEASTLDRVSPVKTDVGRDRVVEEVPDVVAAEGRGAA